MEQVKEKLQFAKYKNIYFVSLIVLVLIALIIKVYADAGHDAPVTEIKQSEQVIVRYVGDTDPDGISQEGLGSFYGEITSKDISSVHASREGVISSWNVSIGDTVTSGSVLGYVTVTGVSSEQQAMLATQEANAYKAKLDADTAQNVANESESIFGKVIDNFKTITNKQKSLYDGNTSTTSSAYLTELKTLEARQLSLQNKLQDFGKTALLEIYSKISNNSIPPDNTNNFGINNLKNGIGAIDSNYQNTYIVYLSNYINLVNNRQLTHNDIRLFLEKTNVILGKTISVDGVDPATIVTIVKELQINLLDLTTALDEATLLKVGKEREYSQLDIDLSKNIGQLENDLALKKLDQYSLKLKAENEAKSATLLSQKLSQSAGGVIPILASRNGVVATIEKDVGDYVTLSERIGYISKNNPVKMVRFTIPPTWRDIKKGDSLSLIWKADFSPGQATLTGISPTINENGGHQAEALVSKETVFPVGSSVRLVPENSKKGVFVNSKAILFDNLNPFVWIVTENQTIRKQEIQVGRQLGEYVEVLSGLEKGFGYLIILDPTISLENGQSINSIMEIKVATSTKATVQDESQPHEH